eukprot:s1810_g10.t1
MGPEGQLESSGTRQLFHGASVITTFLQFLVEGLSEGLSRPHVSIEEQEGEFCHNRQDMSLRRSLPTPCAD